MLRQLFICFSEIIQVYKGYVDDPRNTDNAWMETVAMNFHDDDGSVFAQLEDLLQVCIDIHYLFNH